jgi:hypothetical protein
LQEEGVKKIRLNASLYQPTLAREHRTIRSNIFGPIADTVRALLTRDTDIGDIDDLENISVQVSLSFDRRRGGAIEGNAIEAVAQSVLEEGFEDGFEIITSRNTKMRAGEIVISKPANLTPIGKSVSHIDAWEKIDIFYEEIRIGGALEE